MNKLITIFSIIICLFYSCEDGTINPAKQSEGVTKNMLVDRTWVLDSAFALLYDSLKHQYYYHDMTEFTRNYDMNTIFFHKNGQIDIYSLEGHDELYHSWDFIENDEVIRIKSDNYFARYRIIEININSLRLGQETYTLYPEKVAEYYFSIY